MGCWSAMASPLNGAAAWRTRNGKLTLTWYRPAGAGVPSPFSPCQTAGTRAVSPGRSSFTFRSDEQPNVWSGARFGGTNGIADGLVIDSADQRTRPATASASSPAGGSPGWTTCAGGPSSATSSRRSHPPPCQKTIPDPSFVALATSWTASPARTRSVESWIVRTTPWSSVDRETGAPSTGGGSVAATEGEEVAGAPDDADADPGAPVEAGGLDEGVAAHAIRARTRPLDRLNVRRREVIGPRRRSPGGCSEAMAERAGFEPAMGCPIPHFQCGALGHYATSPSETIRPGGRTRRAVDRSSVAERVGFEPTLALTRPLFESSTINHSDTSPPGSLPDGSWRDHRLVRAGRDLDGRLSRRRRSSACRQTAPPPRRDGSRTRRSSGGEG